MKGFPFPWPASWSAAAPRWGRPFLKCRYWLGLPYLALLGLPLYHNAYYADRWQLLVTNRGSEVELEAGGFANIWEVVFEALSKVPHYLGYHPDQDLGTIAIAVMFVPLGTGLAGSGSGSSSGRSSSSSSN